MVRPVLRLTAVTLSLTVLAACSTGPTGGSGPAAAERTATGDPAGADDASATSQAAGAAFPVTVQHAFGETTIEQDPERIATVGWSDQDILLALGEVPVGATQISWGGNEHGSTDWFDAELAGLGGERGDVTRYADTDGIPVEEIAALQPDLILGTNSGLTQEDYDRLSQIAPVVAYPDVAWGTPWRDSVELVGQAVGRPDQAAAVVQETQDLIDDARAQHPELEGTSMAWTWFTPSDLSTIGIYTSVDLRPQLMRELGMVDAPTVTELTGDESTFFTTLSAEQADTLDADVIFTLLEEEGQEKMLVEDPLLGQIPALASGAYVATADRPLVTAISSPTPLSIPVVLEDFVPLAAEAAQQAR